MTNSEHGIPVMYYLKSGEVGKGSLFYSVNGPSIVTSNNETISRQEGSSFKFLSTSILNRFPHIREEKVSLLPRVLICMGYSTTTGKSHIMYPPSTDDWLSNIVSENDNALYTIQEIYNNEKLLLTITELDNGTLLNAHLINRFESYILEMIRDWTVYNEILYPEKLQSDIFEILNGKPPSWSTLNELIDGLSIPDLVIAGTMGETMNQLVPRSFPEDTRRQIMSFLAWLGTAEIPKEDPVDFSRKFENTGVFRSLVTGHLKCMLDNIDPPHYVQVMTLADQGHLKLVERPPPDLATPWFLAWSKLRELFPVWVDQVIAYVESMNSSDEIAIEFPVSKNDALTSRNHWRDRFALVNHGLFMRGNVRKESVGLRSALYVGGAHKWPHKHLEWSARLSFKAEKQPQIQVLVMPLSALERVTRVIPTVQVIDWETHSVNLSLYNGSKKKWLSNTSIILKSFERTRSFQQLKNEFGSWSSKEILKLSVEEAKVLDMISWGMYLSALESGAYASYYGIENERIRDILNDFRSRGVISLQYFFLLEQLKSVCIVVKGPSRNVCSVTRAFLKHTPSTHAMVAGAGSTAYLISRLPEDIAYSFIESLPLIAKENDINLKSYPISSYAGYRNNLYQRLLLDDGDWDDDVSGLLDQVSFQPKTNTV